MSRPVPSLDSQARSSDTASSLSVAPASLADALNRIQRAPKLTAKQKEEFAAAGRTICKLIGREAAAVPASLDGIQSLLDQVPEAVRTRSRKTLANIKSRLKAGLLHLSSARPVVPRGSPLTGDWADLYGRLPDRRLRHGLSRLMRVACHEGLRPDQITDAFVDVLVDSYRSASWAGKPLHFHRTTVKLWNEAVAKIPGWPQRMLTAPATRRPTQLPFSAFPPAFVAEVDAYLEWLSGADHFAVSGPANPCKPATIALRRTTLRLAASTLAQATGGPAEMRSLSVLVEPENVKTILNAYRSRAGNCNTTFMRNVAVTLLSLARHRPTLLPTPGQLEKLQAIVRKVSRAPTGLTSKNQNLLRQLQDPTVNKQLVNLPATLAEQARTKRFSPARRVQRFQIAVAIELLLAAPVRLQNLGSLQIDKQLVWPTGPDGSLFIVLQEEETKNAQPLEYKVPPHASALVQEYRNRYRVLLHPGASQWLFVREGGLPMTDAALRDGITKAIRRELGIHMTPHQFRHFAAQSMLSAYPGAYPIVMDLLGHKNLKTTATFYGGRRTREAGEAYYALLSGSRQATTGKDE